MKCKNRLQCRGPTDCQTYHIIFSDSFDGSELKEQILISGSTSNRIRIRTSRCKATLLAHKLKSFKWLKSLRFLMVLPQVQLYTTLWAELISCHHKTRALRRPLWRSIHSITSEQSRLLTQNSRHVLGGLRHTLSHTKSTLKKSCSTPDSRAQTGKN